MGEFLFMLTKDDSTVPDCLAVYDEVREADLRWVGFKDIGVPIETLRELTRRIRADGRSVVLEIVSTDAAAELTSVRAGIDLGVDLLMGGTQPDTAIPLLAGTGLRYYPFPGRIVGHPSVLEGTLESITESARELTSRAGVDGLDLLAYRWRGDVGALVGPVVRASAGPIVVAGSIVDSDQIRIVTESGAWGFTIGGAVFDRVLVPGGSLRDQIDWALTTAGTAAASRSPVGQALPQP
jgi:4-hydroxythreonine-4-phosphate dehydrogenase